MSKPHTPEGEENATFSDLKPIVTALQEIGDVKIYGTMYVPRLGGWWMAIGSQVDMNRMLLLDGAPIKDFVEFSSVTRSSDCLPTLTVCYARTGNPLRPVIPSWS